MRVISVFTKISTGLFVSVLSVSVQAAQPGTPEAEPGTTEVQNPDQIPADGEVEVSDTREVIQVIYISNKAEIESANLALERNPQEGLQKYAEQLIRDHSLINKVLEGLANIKSISLEVSEMEESVQLVENKMDQELQILAQLPEEQFRSAYLAVNIAAHQKTLEFFSRVEQGNSDDALKATVAIARQLVESHLADAQRLQAETQQPSPEQPPE